MKTSKFAGVRAVVAASGAALLMFVAGCGGSDDANNEGMDQPTQQETTQAPTDDSGAEAGDDSGTDSADAQSEDSDEASSDDSTTEEDSSDSSDSSDASDSSDSDNDSSDAVTLDDSFKPCDELKPAEVSKVVGFKVGKPQTQDMAGGSICTFTATGGEMKLAMAQFIPMEAPLDQMVSTVKDMFDDASEPEKIDIKGASEGVTFSGKYMSMDATAVYSKVNGGVTQVIVAGKKGADKNGAVALTELMLSKG